MAELTLDRPSAKNAVGRALLAGLRAELAQLRDAAPGNRPRALVLRSAVPGAFCAGADLRERKTMTQDEARARKKTGHTVMATELRPSVDIAVLG